MLARVGHCLLILALLGATGSHWMLLQSVAWTTMLADNLRQGTVSQAFKRTFDGNHPCTLCKDISEGKRAEKQTTLAIVKAKLEFVTEPKIASPQPPRVAEIPQFSLSLPRLTAEPPPVPPPRSLPS